MRETENIFLQADSVNTRGPPTKLVSKLAATHLTLPVASIQSSRQKKYDFEGTKETGLLISGNRGRRKF